MEKVTKFKLVTVMVIGFDKFYHPFTLHACYKQRLFNLVSKVSTKKDTVQEQLHER